MGHGRRVRLPIPELLPVPRQAQEQDRRRAQPAQAVRQGVECLRGSQLPPGAGGEVHDHADSGEGEGGPRAVHRH
uniref:Uncharacterized protein n=1 Tax=Arundo donax TaxID=35708 RepID=A0A0A9EY80_ARUDO